MSFVFLLAEPCPDPGIPKFGKRSGRLFIDQSVVYSCVEGYSLNGDKNRTCTYVKDQGNVWSGTLPVCKGKTSSARFHTVGC